MTINSFVIFAHNMVSPSDSLSPILLLKMANQKEKYDLLITSYELFYVTLTSPQFFCITLSSMPPIFSTFSLINEFLTRPLQHISTAVPHLTHISLFFGSLCYPLIPSITIRKLQPCSYPCVFLGYPNNHRGYKFYDIATQKITISLHVVFNDHSFPIKNLNSPPNYSIFTDDTPHPLYVFFLPNKQQPPQISTPIQLQHHLCIPILPFRLLIPEGLSQPFMLLTLNLLNN